MGLVLEVQHVEEILQPLTRRGGKHLRHLVLAGAQGPTTAAGLARRTPTTPPPVLLLHRLLTLCGEDHLAHALSARLPQARARWAPSLKVLMGPAGMPEFATFVGSNDVISRTGS